MVISTTQLIGQEGAILEVVIGLDLAVLEVVGNQQNLQHVVVDLLGGDEVEGGGGGLAADAVVDHTRTLTFLVHGLIHGIVGIHDTQDVGRDADTEVAVGDVPVVLHLHSDLIQEGDELTLEPLQVTVSKVCGSLKGELSLKHMTFIQALLQTLVLHTGADDRNVFGHSSHDVGVSKVLDRVLDIGTHFLRQAHLDMRTSGNQELLEVVAEGGVNGVGMLSMIHGGIEVHLLDALISTQVDHDGTGEVDLGVNASMDNLTRSSLQIEHARQDIVLSIEVGDSTLGHVDLVSGDNLTSNLGLDLGDANITVDAVQRILTNQQRQILASRTGLQAVDQSLDLDLGTIHEGNLGIGSQSIDQLFLFILISLDGRGDSFDLHDLLIQGASIEQTMQDSLVRSTHRGSDRRSQGNQGRHGGRLRQGGLILQQVVLEDLSNGLSVLLQHVVKALVLEEVGVMLQHHGLDLVRHVLNFDLRDFLTGRLIDHGVAALTQFLNNVLNVAALIHTAKQSAHCLTAPFSYVNFGIDKLKKCELVNSW